MTKWWSHNFFSLRWESNTPQIVAFFRNSENTMRIKPLVEKTENAMMRKLNLRENSRHGGCAKINPRENSLHGECAKIDPRKNRPNPGARKLVPATNTILVDGEEVEGGIFERKSKFNPRRWASFQLFWKHFLRYYDSFL